MKFLNGDNAFTRLVNLILDLVLLNILWTVCCIPLITIGAATTALHDVALQMADEEAPSVIPAFFASFKRNISKGTRLFLLMLAVGLFLAADLYCTFLMEIPGFLRIFIQILILAVTYFYIAVLSHSFSVLARYGRPVFETVRKSFFLAMRNGIYTVYIMLLFVLPFLLFLFAPVLFMQSLLFWIIFLTALCAYLSALHLNRVYGGVGERQNEK